MFKLRVCVALIAAGWCALGCRAPQRAEPEIGTAPGPRSTVHYLEIVTEDAEAVTALYERLHGLSFGAPDADLGQARVATRADGALVGIRKPLAAHERPIVRTYLAVDDIQLAARRAAEQGATVAYGPALQGKRGTFAIVIHGGVQHGLWQR